MGKKLNSYDNINRTEGIGKRTILYQRDLQLIGHTYWASTATPCFDILSKES